MKTNKIKSVLVTGGKVAAGYAGSRFISCMGFAQANPMLQVALPIGGAILTQSLLGKNSTPIAAGMVAGGVMNGIQQYLPGVASALCLPPAPAVAGVPYRSLHSPGVAGIHGQPRVRVRYQ